jgi:hypothetical protein
MRLGVMNIDLGHGGIGYWLMHWLNVLSEDDMVNGDQHKLPVCR